ncbi:MAG: hypothetical protein ABI045_00370 [Flavobacteriales bacterium]
MIKVVANSIKNVETLLEGKIVEDLLMVEIKSTPIAIFYLKNKFGYKDKSEQEIKLKKGLIPIEKWLETARYDPV